jgi:hypothetical protein
MWPILMQLSNTCLERGEEDCKKPTSDCMGKSSGKTDSHSHSSEVLHLF